MPCGAHTVPAGASTPFLVVRNAWRCRDRADQGQVAEGVKFLPDLRPTFVTGAGDSYDELPGMEFVVRAFVERPAEFWELAVDMYSRYHGPFTKDQPSVWSRRGKGVSESSWLCTEWFLDLPQACGSLTLLEGARRGRRPIRRCNNPTPAAVPVDPYPLSSLRTQGEPGGATFYSGIN
jgi:hypothetical protein